MGKIGQIRVNDRIGTIDFFMDGNRLAAVCSGNRFWIDDTDIKDEFQPESSAKDQFIDSGLIGLEPGKKIWIPYSILKTRDVARINRKNDDSRKHYIFLHEQYEPFGLVEFAMFQSLFLIFHEGDHASIDDDVIKHTDKGIQIPSLVKGIHVPFIYIPEDVLKNRDRIRAFFERESHFKSFGVVEGVEILLNDESKLVLRRGKDEIITDSIEMIYGRPAVNVEAFELGHPYIELPHEAAEAFKKAQENKIPEGLKIVPAGKSLLNGKMYYRLSEPLSEDLFRKVKMYFLDFGEESGEMSGWLTDTPVKVENALNLN